MSEQIQTKFSLNIFYFIIRNGIGQKLYNIMIALSLWLSVLNKLTFSIIWW